MAAPKKITAEMEQEIIRRRTSGERITIIAADFGIAHQTVSKLAKRHSASQRELVRRAGHRKCTGRRDGEAGRPDSPEDAPPSASAKRLRQFRRATRLLRTTQARI